MTNNIQSLISNIGRHGPWIELNEVDAISRSDEAQAHVDERENMSSALYAVSLCVLKRCQRWGIAVSPNIAENQ